jgi:hypothetical protein
MDYKQGLVPHMTPELWQAKKIVDSTLHPGEATGQGDMLGTLGTLGTILTSPQIPANRSSCLFECRASCSRTSSLQQACFSPALG